MVGTFVRLKLRLLRNGFSIGQGAVLFAIGAFGAGVLGLTGFVTLALARGDKTAPDLAIVVFGIATLGWTIFPILGFGNDETLDPQRLATLPLSRRQLVTGVLAASLVGVAPLATLLAFSGAFIGFTHGAASTILIAIAVVATLLLCVVASRTLVACSCRSCAPPRPRLHDPRRHAARPHASAPRDVRGRGTHGHDFHQTFVEIAHRVRLTPFAWGGTAVADAARGHYGAAAGLLVGDGRADRGLAVDLVARARTRAHQLRRAGCGTPALAPRAGGGPDPACSRSCRATGSAPSPPRTCATSRAILAGARRSSAR